MSHEHVEQQGASSAPPRHAHEETDINLRGLATFMAALTAVMIGVNLGMWHLFRAFEHRAAERDPPRPPLVDQRQPPAGPRLQVEPAEVAAALRAEEDEELRELRWLDERGRVVRIPVERAMEIVAERGVPEWPAPPELEVPPAGAAGETPEGPAIEDAESRGEP